MKTIVLVALLAAAGCTKKAADAPPGAECAGPINQGMDNMASSVNTRTNNPKMQEMLTAIIGKLRAALLQRCAEDKWPPETLPCFSKVTNQPEMRACLDKLAPELRTKVSTQIRQVMMTGMRPPGMTGHPSPAAGSGDASGSAHAGSAAAPSEPAPGGAAPAGGAAPGGSAAPAGGTAPAGGAAPGSAAAGGGW